MWRRSKLHGSKFREEFSPRAPSTVGSQHSSVENIHEKRASGSRTRRYLSRLTDYVKRASTGGLFSHCYVDSTAFLYTRGTAWVHPPIHPLERIVRSSRVLSRSWIELCLGFCNAGSLDDLPPLSIVWNSSEYHSKAFSLFLILEVSTTGI